MSDFKTTVNKTDVPNVKHPPQDSLPLQLQNKLEGSIRFMNLGSLSFVTKATDFSEV